MKRLSWILTIPLTAIAVLFTVNNLEPIEVRLWPLGGAHVALYLVVLLSLLVGFFAGAGVAWISAGARRRARAMKAHNLALKQELEDLRRRIPERPALTDLRGSARPAPTSPA